MVSRLRTKKATQAAGVLLKLESRKQMSYLRVLKLLYIADRESLKEAGRTITGDRVVAMDQGPVLSELYNVIKDQHIESWCWSRFIARENYNVQLTGDPGNEELSPYEIGKLQEVSEKFAHMDDWALVDFVTHEFDEWKRNKPPAKSSKPIPIEDILDAVGRSADAQAIIEDAENEAKFDRIFPRPPA